MPDADQAGPIEQALEVCVYAPLGFALEVRSLLPRFVERGRSQVALARLIGKYAVAHGSTVAEDAAGRVAGQAQGVLRLVGLVGEAEGRPAAASPPSARAGAPRSDIPRSAARAAGAVDDDRPVSAPPPPVDPATLAIPDYDSLSASQVVPRLDGLTDDELEAVRAYEAGTRSRKTILNKIAQLQAA